MTKKDEDKNTGNRHIFFDSDSDDTLKDDISDTNDKSNKNKRQKKSPPQPPKEEKNETNNRRRQRQDSPIPINPSQDDGPLLSIFRHITGPNFYNGFPSHVNSLRKYICTNPQCDHMFSSKTRVKKVSFDYVSNISQLIELGKTFHCKKNKTYNSINLRVLFELIEPLSELEKMIGLSDIKDKVVDQVLYFLQGYHNAGKKCGSCYDCDMNIPCMKNQSDMLHTAITGKPGVGKTELAKCIGKIYRKLGILSNDKFKVYTRADLIGEYLGHTAVKTQKCIDECKGGVMFIDEVYSLGNNELKDSFSKECIDTINLNLSERRDLLCIIAGYKDAVDNCFFKYNEGLNRRFPFRYDIGPYKWNELKEIFELKVKKGDFTVYYNTENESDSENIRIQELFKKNVSNFPNCGGDMETLFLKCKIIHGRTISTSIESKYVLSYDDISRGIKSVIQSREDDKPCVYMDMFI
jgi:hypothetical protein